MMSTVGSRTQFRTGSASFCIFHFLLFFLAQQQYGCDAFSAQDVQPMKVLVTGAAGKTGRLVLKKLEEDPRYEPKGLVRDEKSALTLVRDGDIHCPLEHVVISDICSPTFLEDLPRVGVQGMNAMIICTSAVPRISRMSLLGCILKVPFNVLRRKPAIDIRRVRFVWKHGGYPEKVDYHGQVAQFQLAKKLGMEHVVLISSMGGTNPDNFLNKVGKRKDGSGHGDILKWKRKAEMELITSGLDYTIIHPGGLVDTPGGVEELILDVDDNLGRKYTKTSISREDVADLCVSALSVAKGQNVSFDCITAKPLLDDSDHKPNGDHKQNDMMTMKASDKALATFLHLSKTADYAL